MVASPDPRDNEIQSPPKDVTVSPTKSGRGLSPIMDFTSSNDNDNSII